MNNQISPTLITSDWFNTPSPISIDKLQGKVVLVHAFQMLCPGCVSHGIPQASVIHDAFSNDQVQVIGLHSVFEHHAVMTPEALKVFIHEYKITFPVAVDKPSTDSSLPKTMSQWNLQGTPSLILFDKFGQCRLKHFGRLSDLQLGTIVGGLVAEQRSPADKNSIFNDYQTTQLDELVKCTGDTCQI